MGETAASQFESLLASGETAPGQPLSQFWSRADGHLHVQWYRGDAGVHFAPHLHSEFNIVVALDGAVETEQLGERTLVEGGEAMMGSNPGVEHASWYRPGSKSCEAVSLTFSPEYLGEVVGIESWNGKLGRAYLGKIYSAKLAGLGREVLEEMRERAIGYETVIEGLAARLVIESLRMWPEGRVEWVEVDRRPRLARRDHIRAFEFMKWCRKDAFRIQHLCRFLGTSEERFNRLFRAATHDSPANFYQTMLLEEARGLLRGSNAAVKEVSYQLGFKTPSHFVVSFRRQFGCTPQEYRLRGEA